MTRQRILVLAGQGPRARLTEEAATRVGLSCSLLDWATFIARPAVLAERLHGCAALRIDSPDRDFSSLAAIHAIGEAPAKAQGYATVQPCATFLGAPGTIGSPAQMFFGLAESLSAVEKVADDLGIPVSHRAADVMTAHDKLATHERLAAAGVPMPEPLGPIVSFDDLMDKMDCMDAPRVFLKLRHGSAAAGMIALARRGNGEMRATTTALLTSDGLRSTRQVHTLTTRSEITPLVDALAPLGLFAERWMARASIGNGPCDLRIVSVAGKMFPILRTSRHPMTNLHLGGNRMPVDALRERMPSGAWDALMQTASTARAAYPGALSVGLDVAVANDLRRHAVLEVNAFGDFVKGLDSGEQTLSDRLFDALVPGHAQAAVA